MSKGSKRDKARALRHAIKARPSKTRKPRRRRYPLRTVQRYLVRVAGIMPDLDPEQRDVALRAIKRDFPDVFPRILRENTPELQRVWENAEKEGTPEAWSGYKMLYHIHAAQY